MEEKIKIIPEFSTNKNGVRIKKCCASCLHHQPFDPEGPRRQCMLGEGKKKKRIVYKFNLCRFWTISEMIDNIKVNGRGACDATRT